MFIPYGTMIGYENTIDYGDTMGHAWSYYSGEVLYCGTIVHGVAMVYDETMGYGRNTTVRSITFAWATI
jgi:hypothetical protein